MNIFIYLLGSFFNSSSNWLSAEWVELYLARPQHQHSNHHIHHVNKPRLANQIVVLHSHHIHLEPTYHSLTTNWNCRGEKIKPATYITNFTPNHFKWVKYHSINSRNWTKQKRLLWTSQHPISLTRVCSIFRASPKRNA